jgi:hypothetical protein
MLGKAINLVIIEAKKEAGHGVRCRGTSSQVHGYVLKDYV